MYVRLAFAVAAHLDTEILLVDEVLAVGDAEFRQKCLGKMKDVASAGRTVIFVSHELSSIRQICGTAVELEKGGIRRMGDAGDVVAEYLSTVGTESILEQSFPSDERPGTGDMRVRFASLDEVTYRPDQAKRIAFRIERQLPTAVKFFFVVQFRSQDGNVVSYCDSRLTQPGWYEPADALDLDVVVTHPWLTSGKYSVDIVVWSIGLVDVVDNALRFEVTDDSPYPNREPEDMRRWAYVLPNFSIDRANGGGFPGRDPVLKDEEWIGDTAGQPTERPNPARK
jgi:lipopolysaccharide transport system ATP-binding protein